jgi:hypothetical protein
VPSIMPGKRMSMFPEAEPSLEPGPRAPLHHGR